MEERLRSSRGEGTEAGPRLVSGEKMAEQQVSRVAMSE